MHTHWHETNYGNKYSRKLGFGKVRKRFFLSKVMHSSVHVECLCHLIPPNKDTILSLVSLMLSFSGKSMSRTTPMAIA